MQVNDINKNRHDSLVLALVCFLLQVALAPHLALANGHINFALIYCAVMALTVGGGFGVGCGFLAGLVFDLSTTGPMGLMTLLLTIASFVMGMETRNRLKDDVSAAVILFLIVSLLTCLLYNLAMFLVGLSGSLVDMLFLRTIPTFVLTSLAFLPFAYLNSRGSASRTLGLGLRGSGRRPPRRPRGGLGLGKL